MGGFGYGKKNKKKRLNDTDNLSIKKERRLSMPREYAPVELKNDLFEAYYKGKIIPDSEWNEFFEKMKEPLPVTFRLPSSSTPDGKVLIENLEKYLVETFPLLERIQWYPQPGSAWKVSAGRTQVRKDIQYTSLHSLLVRETDVGNICRQEAVSMIPPLFLQVHSSDTILDMCAAPGSKTCQLIENMHAGENFSLPTGVVVANDVDDDRASMMVHQVKRMCSPCLVVTTTDAAQFPKSNAFEFDKILCDVPCSGDGTLRKNKLIWRTWHPRHAEALHPLQVSILERGLFLLRPGGRLVYSTCSLNPVENEQVIEEVLSKLGPNEYQLLDLSSHLPDLQRRPGISSDTTTIPLERCMRFYPHLQDTGGFFVAVIEKLPKNTDLSSNSDNSNPSTAIDTPYNLAAISEHSSTSVPLDFNIINNQSTLNNCSIEPSSSIGSDPSSIALDQWEIDKKGLEGHMISRQQYPQDKEKNLLPQLSLISTKAKLFIEKILNPRSCPVIYAGLAAFVRQDGNESYRIKYQALPYLSPFLNTSKLIPLTELSDIQLLLAPISPACKAKVSEGTGSTTVNDPPNDALDGESGPGIIGSLAVRFEALSHSLQAILAPLSIGCHAAKIIGKNCSTSVPLWKGRSSVNLLVSKVDKASLLFHWLLILRH